MRIVTVIPISKGLLKDTLSYFTKENPEIGCLIKIPLRKKIVYGIVLDNRNVEDVKSELKSLPFQIRKIDDLHSENFLSENFINAIKKTSEWHATGFGATFFQLIPKIILESKTEKSNIKKTEYFHEINLLQSENEERFATYKSIIREEFARGNSVFFIAPNIEDLENSKINLEKGIEKYTYILHSKQNKKEQIETINNLRTNEHPILVISTASYLAIERSDLGLIILDKESSRNYKTQTRPYIDIRKFIEILSKELKVRLVLGDNLLRLETLWEEKNGKFISLSPLKFRSLTTAECRIENMRSPEDQKEKEFKIIGEKLKNILNNVQNNNENLFLFCSRKGLYPQTICSDCGTVFVCKNCNKPVVLYSKIKEKDLIKNIFICNHCGQKYDSVTKCHNCNSWRLTPLGIGIERVEQEIKELFPNIKTLIFDKEHVTTQKKAEKIRDTFYKNPGTVLLGTEMVIPFLNQKIENIVVSTIDSYFSIPDYQINEKVFQILINLRNTSIKNFIIQTRQKDLTLFEYAIRGNLLDFVKNELEEREELGYPPFNTYIKFTLSGEKNSTRKEMEKLKDYFENYNLEVFDSFLPHTKGKHSVNGLLYIEREKWPNEDLVNKIKKLPPQFSVRIDPSNLL